MTRNYRYARREKRLVQSIFYSNPDGYPPVVNGAHLLARAGYSVQLVGVGESRGVFYPPGVQVLRIPLTAGGSVSGYLCFASRVLRLGRRSAELYMGHDMHGFLLAWLLARFHRRPLVYHCHDYAGSVKGGGLFVKLFERLFARTADLVIVPDLERGKVIAKALALRQPPIVVANAPLRRSRATGDDLLHTLAAQGRQYRRILLRQGSIGPNHALEPTIRSIPFWASRAWGLVLVGMGAPEYLDRLVHLARELGVEEQLTILPPVSYDAIMQLTPGADVGHALYEPVHINNVYITTASNKIMEYMAAGLPIVVSDRPGLRALVEKYGCGLTADEGSPESIAVAVNTLMGDPELAHRLGAAGARAFEAEFNYERQFAPVLGALRRLSHSDKGGRG